MNYQILHNLSAEYIQSLKARFWAKVDTSGGSDACWEWTGALNSKGYGCIGVSGRSQLSHRVSFELAHGPIPPGHLVCHRCDNPPCVNPAHLFGGTDSDNMQDAAQKGKLVNPKLRKFTRQQVIELRNNYDPKSDSLTTFAEKYGVTRNTIRAILTGETYARAGGRIWSQIGDYFIDDETYNQVKPLHEQGLSLTAIADKLGIGLASASRIVNGAQRSAP